MKLINDNKNSNEKEKYLLQEKKQIIDDLEKTTKMILNLKSYAFFVHSVLGEPIKTTDGKVISENILNDTVTRDKDIEKVCSKIIDELGKMDIDNNLGVINFIDTNRLTSKFAEMEENVLKILDKKHNIDRELKVLEEIYANDLKVKFFEINFFYIQKFFINKKIFMN